MSTSFFIFGAIQLITGLATLIFYEQENFITHKFKYENIGKNKSRLVVYFSRMGYTKKVAMEEANRTGAMLYEIKATEKTEGTSGFWWCGRFGMHRWGMPIESINIELEKFDEITICSPIWVFNIAGPIKTFCETVSGKISNVNYILVHFQKNSYVNAAYEMDTLLKCKAKKVISICSRRGKEISVKTIR